MQKSLTAGMQHFYSTFPLITLSFGSGARTYEVRIVFDPSTDYHPPVGVTTHKPKIHQSCVQFHVRLRSWNGAHYSSHVHLLIDQKLEEIASSDVGLDSGGDRSTIVGSGSGMVSPSTLSTTSKKMLAISFLKSIPSWCGITAPYSPVAESTGEYTHMCRIARYSHPGAFSLAEEEVLIEVGKLYVGESVLEMVLRAIDDAQTNGGNGSGATTTSIDERGSQLGAELPTGAATAEEVTL